MINIINYKNIPFRITALIVILFQSACSPYIYKEEISAFQEGVIDSVSAFNTIKQRQRDYLLKKRNKNLEAKHEPAQFSTRCYDFHSIYTKDFASSENTLQNKDYEDCFIEPTGLMGIPELKEGSKQIDPILPNLTMIGQGLEGYVKGLDAITRAEDEAELKSAFTKFNNSATNLVEAVNGKLQADSKAKVAGISELVYQAGIAYLNHKRFKALKDAVNETDHIVKKSAELLSEGTFYISEYEINAAEKEIAKLEVGTNTATGTAYVAAWKKLDEHRNSYLDLFRKSPIRSFQKMVVTHEALKKSLNNPRNQKQMQAVFDNVTKFRNTAKEVLTAFEKEKKVE